MGLPKPRPVADAAAGEGGSFWGAVCTGEKAWGADYAQKAPQERDNLLFGQSMQKWNV